MKNYEKVEKYPAVGRLNLKTGEVERMAPGKHNGVYTGILYNGDCRVYKKPVLHQLKHMKCDTDVIKKVKKSRGDLEIARILIEADLMNVLVHVFNACDASVSVSDYIDEEYEKVIQEFRTWGDNNITPEKICNSDEPWQETIGKIDAEIAKKADAGIEKLAEVKERCDAVREKFSVARAEELKRLEKELQNLRMEKEAIKEKLKGLEWD